MSFHVDHPFVLSWLLADWVLQLM